MTDIEKAADVAASVLPGPIGEALSQFLNDGVAIKDAQANPHLMKVIRAIVGVARLRNLSPAQTVLAVPLGVAVFLVSEAVGWTPVSSEDGAV